MSRRTLLFHVGACMQPVCVQATNSTVNSRFFCARLVKFIICKSLGANFIFHMASYADSKKGDLHQYILSIAPIYNMILRICVSWSLDRCLEELVEIVCLLSSERHTLILHIISES